MLRLSVASWVLFGLAPVVVTAADTRAETLVVVTAAGPNSMDIHGVGANRPAYGASWNLYDRLVSFGSKVLPDGSRSYDHTQVVPELAESWEISPDRLSLTFHLRRDAVFHMVHR